ncbi:MAG: class I SAM-dependent methyltransferase [Thermoleophilia bacterium]|nr:class I SAM-dependent methyltransferase [Thermoleophilia bacterium]
MNGLLYDACARLADRKGLAELRRRAVAGLGGRVLEVGAGTGLNLPHYRRAERVVAVEPDRGMATRLRRRAARAPVPVQLVEARAEELPFPDGTFDHVVLTLVLCSVADPARALEEARRVLRPGGSVTFVEHVRGQGRLGRWQDRLTPLHRRLAGNCHLNRATAAAVASAGFRVDWIEQIAVPGGHPLVRPGVHGRATRTSS